MDSCTWLLLEARAHQISVFCSLMIWTISLFVHPLTLMLFKFSRRCNLPDLDQFPQISPGDNIEPGIASIDPLLSDKSPAPTTTSTLPKIKFVVFLVSFMILLKHLIRTWLRYLSMFRSCHGSLRTNRCFDLMASDISFLKSVSSDLLCLLQHFSVGYFKPAAQNSYWYQTNDYHSGLNDHSWILYLKPGHYSFNYSWLIAFIVNTIFVNYHNLI
jgi:hypothetical protein